MTNKIEPAYFAIIPASVRYDDNLPDKAKLLFGEITALTNKHGYCYASNKYFAELYKCSERTISRLINQLADENYFKIFHDGNCNRKIYPNENAKIEEDRQKCPEGKTKMSKGVDKNVHEDRQKCLQISKDNNTLNNKVNIPEALKAIKGFNKIWDEFKQHRKELKKKLTPTSTERLFKMLQKQPDPIAVIEQSIEKGWQGLFPLKNYNTPPAAKNRPVPDEYIAHLKLMAVPPEHYHRAVEIAKAKKVLPHQMRDSIKGQLRQEGIL